MLSQCLLLAEEDIAEALAGFDLSKTTVTKATLKSAGQLLADDDHTAQLICIGQDLVEELMTAAKWPLVKRHKWLHERDLGNLGLVDEALSKS